MKNLINKILSVFKNKSGKEFQFNNIYRVCSNAKNELDDYCKVEGLSGR
jgi:hypothetical protein